MLGPSWNAPIGALPHDDRAGTHDSADGHCGSYASIGAGQAVLLWITLKVENACKDTKAGALNPGFLAGFDAPHPLGLVCPRCVVRHPNVGAAEAELQDRPDHLPRAPIGGH
jgi:hypothetical protein